MRENIKMKCKDFQSDGKWKEVAHELTEVSIKVKDTKSESKVKTAINWAFCIAVR